MFVLPLIILPTGASFSPLTFSGCKEPITTTEEGYSYTNKWVVHIQTTGSTFQVIFDTKEEAMEFIDILHAAVLLSIEELRVIDLSQKQVSKEKPKTEPLCPILKEILQTSNTQT